MKYIEILKKNKELKKITSSKPYDISIISNIIINQLKDVLEFYLRTSGINPLIQIGDYDNIVQDSFVYKNSKLVIVFWELSNLTENIHNEIEFYNEEKFNSLVEKIKLEIDLVFENLKNTQLVLFNEFSSSPFSFNCLEKTNFDKLNYILNQYLKENIPSNFKIVETEKIFLNTGINNSLELRNFYSSKALFSIQFYKSYSSHIKPYIMSACGKSKKALIFDCDNTLWNGILGEDGFKNIDMSSKSSKGMIFNEVQKIALKLNKKGVILGLCSKNNLEDVDEVLKSHPDMLINNEHIAVKKINWNDKASNLKEIADELNIGLDSIVFIDDSSFEVNLIKSTHPDVKVIQVPEKIHEYPQLLRNNLNLFYNLSYSEEDLSKTKMYEEENKRKKIKNSFNDIKDYISSLGLRMIISKNDNSNIERLAQLTQKTNQFNLTTKRYSAIEIENFLNDSNYRLISISLNDKFGDYGITGLVIIKLNKNNADIDTFLMSCRIIGRKIEYVLMDHIIELLSNDKVAFLNAQYIKTKKNCQVEPFYTNCSFETISNDSNKINYKLVLNNYKKSKINYINVEKNGE